MKSVCLCRSFRFFQNMLKLEAKLKAEGISCLRPAPSRFRKPEKPSESINEASHLSYDEMLEEARRMSLDHFNRIDLSDVVYVVNPNGYVGNSVIMEIGYAYGKDKPIYSSNQIDDLAVMSLVESVLSYEDLISLLKS